MATGGQGPSSPWISAASLAKPGQDYPQTTPGSKPRAQSGLRARGTCRKSIIVKPFNFSDRFGPEKAKPKTDSEKGSGKNLAGKSSPGASLTRSRVLETVATTSASKGRTPELPRKPLRSLGEATSLQRKPSLKRSSIASPSLRRSDIPKIVVQRSSLPESGETSEAKLASKPGSKNAEDASTVANDVFHKGERPSPLVAKKAPAKPPRPSVNRVPEKVASDANEVLTESPSNASQSKVKEVPKEKNINIGERNEEEDKFDETFSLVGSPPHDLELEEVNTVSSTSDGLQVLTTESSSSSSDVQVLTTKSSEDGEDQCVVVTVSAHKQKIATISINTHAARKRAAHSGLKFFGKTIKKDTKMQPSKFLPSGSNQK